MARGAKPQLRLRVGRAPTLSLNSAECVPGSSASGSFERTARGSTASSGTRTVRCSAWPSAWFMLRPTHLATRTAQAAIHNPNHDPNRFFYSYSYSSIFIDLYERSHNSSLGLKRAIAACARSVSTPCNMCRPSACSPMLRSFHVIHPPQAQRFPRGVEGKNRFFRT